MTYSSKTSRCVTSRRATKSRRKSPRSVRSKKKSNVKSKVRFDKKMSELDIICLPKSLEGLANKCACNERWLKRERIGSGEYGKAYRACRANNCDYVVKVQPDDKYARAEVKAYLKLRGKRITPKFYAAWRCRGKMYIVIERLYKCKNMSEDEILAKAEKLAQRMKKYGCTHGDVHFGNVLCGESGVLLLFDFGLSHCK